MYLLGKNSGLEGRLWLGCYTHAHNFFAIT